MDSFIFILDPSLYWRERSPVRLRVGHDGRQPCRILWPIDAQEFQESCLRPPLPQVQTQLPEMDEFHGEVKFYSSSENNSGDLKIDS